MVLELNAKFKKNHESSKIKQSKRQTNIQILKSVRILRTPFPLILFSKYRNLLFHKLLQLNQLY